MAAPSPVFIGRDLDYEREQARIHGVDIRKLLTIAQEIMFGLLQSDVIHVPIESLRERLVGKFPDHPASHLVSAFVRRAQRRDAEADADVARARALAADDHPASFLLPSDQDWRCEGGPTDLEEVVTGQVWRVAQYYGQDSVPLLKVQFGTLFRVGGDELVFVNPVPLAERAAAAVSEFGRVTTLLAPTAFHGRNLQALSKQFPDAAIVGVPAHLKRADPLPVEFDGVLDPTAPRWRGELDAYHVPGTMFDEFALYHAASKTLLFQDLVMFGPSRTDTFHDRLYRWSWGAFEPMNFSGYVVLFWQKMGEIRAGFDPLRSLDIEHVANAHADWSAAEHDARTAFHGLLEQLGTISLGSLRLNFFWRHPRLFRDLLKYKLRQARAAKARAA